MAKKNSSDKAKKAIKSGYQVREDKPTKDKQTKQKEQKSSSKKNDVKKSKAKVSFPKPKSGKQGAPKKSNKSPSSKSPKKATQVTPKAQPNIRWMKKDNEKIAKAVRRANAKASRLNKKGHQINKITVKDVKAGVTNRVEFNKLLKDIDKFVERGSEKGKDREHIWDYEKDFYRIKHNLNEKRKAKELEAYNNEVITQGGKPLKNFPLRKDQTGKNSFMTHREARFKPYSFEVKNRAQFNRQAHSIDVGMSKKIDRNQEKTYRDNWVITMHNELGSYSSDLQEMVAMIPPDKWDYLARTELTLEIGNLYPGNEDAAKKEAEKLRKVIEPYFEKTVRKPTIASLKRKGVPEGTLRKIENLSNAEFAHNFVEEIEHFTREDKLGYQRKHINITTLSDISEIISKFGN